jgi:superfamily II RNA helicase
MPRPRQHNGRRKGQKRPDRSRHRDERGYERELATQSSFEKAPARQTLRDLEAVKRLLDGIGVPDRTEFKPDDFQLEALQAFETEDVLVTAPTGSGKTWIAREEIRRILGKGQRAWYTTPLKALTNSKYIEFSLEFGAEKVGILTGDRKENTDAQLIVGTTEIFRNQLFDALRESEQVRTDFVIIDEAHYLADEDRGHVWEVTIILTPPRIRMLLLSATVGKAEEFAKWIGDVRGTKVRVINRAGSRPVELRAAYISKQLQLSPLFDEQGNFTRELEQFEREKRRDYRRRR